MSSYNNKYILKFKEFDEHSFRDMDSQTASFALYGFYKDQSELQGIINSEKLNKKYGDTSLTNDNVIDFIRPHIKDKYLLFCMASFEPQCADRLDHFWNAYSHNNGFVILYSKKDVIDFASGHNLFHLQDVIYSDEKMELTDFVQCFLDSCDREGGVFNDQRFYELLHKANHHKDIFDFMCIKTKYEYSLEEEIRMIKLVTDDVIVNSHCQLPFLKPLKIFILDTSHPDSIQKLVNICDSFSIPWKIVSRYEKLF